MLRLLLFFIGLPAFAGSDRPSPEEWISRLTGGETAEQVNGVKSELLENFSNESLVTSLSQVADRLKIQIGIDHSSSEMRQHVAQLRVVRSTLIVAQFRDKSAQELVTLMSGPDGYYALRILKARLGVGSESLRLLDSDAKRALVSRVLQTVTRGENALSLLNLDKPLKIFELVRESYGDLIYLDSQRAAARLIAQILLDREAIDSLVHLADILRPVTDDEPTRNLVGSSVDGRSVDSSFSIGRPLTNLAKSTDVLRDAALRVLLMNGGNSPKIQKFVRERLTEDQKLRLVRRALNLEGTFERASFYHQLLFLFRPGEADQLLQRASGLTNWGEEKRSQVLAYGIGKPSPRPFDRIINLCDEVLTQAARFDQTD